MPSVKISDALSSSLTLIRLQKGMISTAGVDPNVPIQMIKPGGGCSAMIGDGFGSHWKAASIKRAITITPNNYNFYYSYAVVMQNPSHSQIDQPWDINNLITKETLVDCGPLTVEFFNDDTG